MGVPLLAKVSTATKLGELALPGQTIPPGFDELGPPHGAVRSGQRAAHEVLGAL